MTYAWIMCANCKSTLKRKIQGTAKDAHNALVKTAINKGWDVDKQCACPDCTSTPTQLKHELSWLKSLNWWQRLKFLALGKMYFENKKKNPDNP